MVTETVLNKDYWYLLPVQHQQVLYKIELERENAVTLVRVRKGVVTVPGHLEIEMPMSREKLLREQNVEWEAPVNIENLGELDERACGIVLPEINPVSSFTKAGWRAPMNSVLQFIRTLEKKNQALPFLYIGVRKRFDITSVLRPWKWPYLCWCRNYYPGADEVEKVLTEFGYGYVRRYALLDQGNDREEVLLEERYQSSENLLGWRGRIKDWLLRGKGFRRLSSAFFLVAQPSPAPGVAEKICNELNREDSGITRLDSTVTPKKLVSLLLPRKVILYVGDAQATRAIIVISRMRQVEERREREAKMLVRLENQGLTGIVKSPRFLGSGDWEGAKFYVQEAKPGTAIDMMQKGLPEVQEQAFELIHAFHAKTKTAINFDQDNYHDIAGWIISTGMEKYSGVKEIGEKLRQVDTALKDLLTGRTVNLSWMHGDYKIENMIVDPGTRKIEGIIDWEHAREIGIPSIDTWYFLLYNRHLTESRNMFDIIEQVCLNGNTNPEERHMLDAHNRLFDYDDALDKIMKSLFVLHHVCCRMTYDLSIPGYRHGVESLMQRTQRTLEACR